MACKKRSTLPTITAADIDARQGDLRRTANGWAWKCAHCGQFASSETLAGNYVCRSHGGVTGRQRDPVARDEAKRTGKKVPRPPGRPLKSGQYSRRPGVRVDEILADYQARKVNADNTDEDMLYLRAHLHLLMEQAPAVSQLQDPLERLATELEGLQQAGGTSSEAAGADVAALMKEARHVLKDVIGYTAQLERRHERLIKLAKVRAETRLKDSAGRQTEVFQLLVRRLFVVLREQLSPADYAALERRMQDDLAEVPVGLVDGSSSVKA